MDLATSFTGSQYEMDVDSKSIYYLMFNVHEAIPYIEKLERK